MKKTRIGLVGLGHSAKDFHLPCLTKFDDVEVVVSEPWEDRLKAVSAEWNIKKENQYTDIDTMLAKGNVDGVYVLMPQYVLRTSLAKTGQEPPYVEYLIKALDAKKPVFSEKPFGVSTAQVDPVMEAVKRNGVVTTMCGYQRRFNPLLQHCLKLVKERGPILNCAFSFFKGLKANNNDEQVVINQNWLTLDMVHCLDLMRSIPDGEITDFMSTVGVSPGDDLLTAFHAMAKFDSGTTATFASNVRAGARVLNFELHGVGISAYMRNIPLDDRIDDVAASSSAAMEAVIYTDGDEKTPKIVHTVDIAENNLQQCCAGFWGENRNFVDSIQQGIPSKTPFEDAYKTTALCERILADNPFSAVGV